MFFPAAQREILTIFEGLGKSVPSLKAAEVKPLAPLAAAQPLHQQDGLAAPHLGGGARVRGTGGPRGRGGAGPREASRELQAVRDSAASAGPAQRPAARLGRWRGPCGAPAGRQALGPTRAREGMRRSAGPGLALSLLLALLGRGGAFYLEVRELEEKCFIQEIPDGTVVIGARARPVRALPSRERKGDGAARTQLRPAPTLPCPGWAPGKWVDRGLTKASLPLRVRAPGGKSGQDPDGGRRSWEGRKVVARSLGVMPGRPCSYPDRSVSARHWVGPWSLVWMGMPPGFLSFSTVTVPVYSPTIHLPVGQFLCSLANVILVY